MSDRCLTVRIIDSELIFNHGIVHNILTEKCDKRKICAKLVPKKKPLLPTNKRKSEGMCAWTFMNASKMTKISSNMS